MNIRVLVIEDNEQNLYLMRFLLEKHGYAVVEAKDGRKGIEMAKEANPHIILLDIQLPEMDGYSVARELRRSREYDHIPIIAVSSYAMVGDREKALEAGVNDYIEKPIDPDTFIEQVKKFIPFNAPD